MQRLRLLLTWLSPLSITRYCGRALEVEVSVEAAWPIAPLAAELLEGFAEVGHGPAYLRALAQHAELADADSWRRVAAEAAAEARKASSEDGLFARYLSLQVRHATASARVEASRGLERADREKFLRAGDCSFGAPWILLSQPGEPVKTTCNHQALADLASQLRSGTHPWLNDVRSAKDDKVEQLQHSPLDHVLYTSEPAHVDARKAIGYADLGSPEATASVFKALLGLAKVLEADRQPGYVVFRHGSPITNTSTRAVLAGYGVNLLARSADEVTKSADGDGPVPTATGQAEVTSSGESSCNLDLADVVKDPAEHFYGLDLEKIAELHPEAKPALCNVRADLQASAEAPVPPWELKYLGFHAATRVTRIARENSGLDGLAALEEAAQSFPSGWAHALASESSGGEAGVRDLMKSEDQFPGEGQLEINGWLVPKKKRGLLQLMHAHAPLFKAIELLGQQGFKEAETVEVLRDSRPGVRAPDRVMTPDPRINSDGQEHSSLVIFDMRTDPETDDVRKQSKQDDRRMGMPGSQGPLIRLMQMYGRFWGYPPPVPRALLGIGFAIDPCNRAHVKFFVDQISTQWPPAVMWLQLEAVAKDGESAPSTESNVIVSKLRGAIAALVQSPGGAPSARQFLKLWLSHSRNQESDGLCVEADDIINACWKKGWKSSTPPPLTPMADDASSEFAKLPVPSATVNGKVLFGDELFEGFEQLCKTELQQVVVAIGRGQVDVTASDGDIARWQLGLDQGKELLKVFHPVIKPGRGKYIPLAPSQLQGLPGGFVHQDDVVPPTAPTVVHVVLLGHPVSLSAVEDAANFLEAFANRALTLPKWRRWWIGIAVAGECSTTAKAAEAGSAPLSLAGAMRRCLAAVVPANAGTAPASLAGRQMNSASFSMRLQAVVSAWRKVSKAADGQDAAKMILQACSDMVQAKGLTIDAGKLRKDALSVDSDDVSNCAAQHDSESALGPAPSGAAVVLANGRLHGPIFYEQSGVKFSAAHVAFTEEVELSYGHQLRGLTAKRFPWRDAPGGESKQYPSAGAVEGLRRAGAGDDPLLLAFAMAVRARAVEDAVVVREGGDSNEEGDGAPVGRHIEEGDDEHGLSPLQQAFVDMPDDLKLHVPHNPDLPSPLRIYAVIDPLSQDAQRLPPVLRLLHKELNAELHILLRPQTLVVPPITGYYRAAEVAPAPPGGLAALWQWDGAVHNPHFILPPRRSLLLSTLLHTPDAWHCSAVDSGGADLDSLLAVHGGVVRARYALEAMFVEGWATKASAGGWPAPAAGRHLALVPVGGTIGREGMAGRESVVVKSGYFQLHVPPGLYNLVLQGATDESLVLPKGPVELAALAGRGSALEAQVDGSAKGSSKTSVYSDPESPSYEGAGGDKSKCKETIHIFSVASGHRYERLLRIMVLSARQHTKCPLRLWLVDNFLSPNFRRLLPALAAEVGFAVSRVTYKWPAWLREQTEKQRVIWAYKILFLDVFFPLQVKRVLFIDADQIVRADIKELWDIDLKGRVYGMVPFCGSGPSASSSWFGSEDKSELRNPETVGLRFWEQGFWQSHLGSDRYYHISALFVVDLVLFRQVGAGDILRDVYQSLTADPHSLSNLDQDLPNYVQARQLPIFSLPPEWLWCETWCSEATKPKAKTIDMCQNPVRKEGKLQQARRIAPEWTKYDEQLAKIIEKAANATDS